MRPLSIIALVVRGQFYERGFVPHAYWLSMRANMKSVLSRPFPRSVMDSDLDEMRPALRAVVVKIGAEIDTEKAE